jgi:hypothetical protein
MYDCMCERALICNNPSLLTKLEHYLSGIDVHCWETYSKLSVTPDKFAIIDSHDIRGAIYACCITVSIQTMFFDFYRINSQYLNLNRRNTFMVKSNSLHRWMVCDKNAQSSQHSKLRVWLEEFIWAYLTTNICGNV